MHSWRRILLMAFVLGTVLAFTGLRLSTPSARADSTATLMCGTGNPQFQNCTFTLNVTVNAGGSFTATLNVAGAVILGCSSIPAGTPCSHSTNTATFQCPGGCAAGSQYQDVIAGPPNAGVQQTITINYVPVYAPTYAPMYAPSYPSYGAYGGGCYWSLYYCGGYNNTLVTCGVWYIASCGGSGFSYCNGVLVSFFCPNNCTPGLFCGANFNNNNNFVNSNGILCFNGQNANCSGLPNPLCLSINNGTIMTRTC